MTKQQVKTAERKAMEVFDKWNDCTCVVDPNGSYYSEIESVIEDAVHIGIQMALKGKVFYSGDGDVMHGQQRLPAKNAAKIYVFDLDGELIDTMLTVKIVAEKYGVNWRNLNSAVLRKSLVGQKYYFSKNPDFVIPDRIKSHNPLQSKNKAFRIQ